MHFVDAILMQSRLQPFAPALSSPGSFSSNITYAHLARMIGNVVRNANESGVRKGALALLAISDPLLHMVLTLGLVKAGVICATYPRDGMPEAISPDYILSDRKLATSAAHLRVDASWTEGPGLSYEALATIPYVPTDGALVVFTSGSTGTSKAVLFSSEQVSKRVHTYAMINGYRFAEASRFLIDMGIGTSLGFSMALSVLWRGGAVLFRGRSVPETLEFLAVYKVEIIVATPKSLFEIATVAKTIPSFPGTLSAIFTGGDLNNKLAVSFVKSYLTPNIISNYGATEAGRISAATSNTLDTEEGAVGYLLPGVRVSICDESGDEVPGAREGVLRVWTPGMASGYVGGKGVLTHRFHLEGFLTNDIVEMKDNRMLILKGRRDNLLNIGGEKISPELVERAVLSSGLVRDAGAFVKRTNLGVPILCCAVVWTQNDQQILLKDYLRQALSPQQLPIRIIGMDALPHIAGKLDRSALSKVPMQ